MRPPAPGVHRRASGKGCTWRLHNNVFAWVDAGDPGRADIAWYGTDCTVKACEDPNNPSAGPDSVLGDWSLYFTQTLNGLDATPSFLPPVLAGEHFIHRGSMFTLIGGQSGDRALGDFLKLRIGPDGGATISYSDSNNGSAGDLAPHAMFVRQIGGTGVFASKTVSGPAPPRNSVTDPAGDGKYRANGQVTANIPNLDILSSSITRPDATHYRIKVTVADLRSLAPPGPPDSDTDLVWLTQWLVPSSTDPGGGRYFFAYMESTGGGAPSFFDGVAHSTNDFYVTYPGKNQVTGSFTPTAPGTITIDVPAADVGEAGPISNTLFSVTASTMTLPQAANSCPINPTNGEGGCLFNLTDLTPAYDSVPSKSVVGHAHTDYNHNGKAGPGDVHVIVSSPTPEFVEYWDLRKNPPGPAGSNIRCGGPPSAVTRVSQDTIEIDGKISFCRSLSRAKTYRLIVSDGGPNPPNRDHYDMTLFGKGGGVVYHNADFTTVGLGDLAVTQRGGAGRGGGRLRPG